MPWILGLFPCWFVPIQALARWWQRHRMVLGAADAKGIYIWWCLFVNNQFRLLEDGQTQDTSDFVHVFGQQVEGIGKMLMCLDQIKKSQYTWHQWRLRSSFFEVFGGSWRLSTAFSQHRVAFTHIHIHEPIHFPHLVYLRGFRSVSEAGLFIACLVS